MRPFAVVLALAYGATLGLAQSFDYIIVGAGTSGLVVANRLSEDPSVTVAVIEPGTDQRSNPNVTDPTKFGQAFGTPIDWNYKTAQRAGATGRELLLPQGKAWGGSSVINGMTYIRGDVAEIDAWEDLGNTGWNWATLLPYYKKSEKYRAPSDTQLAAGATFQPQHHGFNGPVHVGYISGLQNGSFAPAVLQTWEGLSLPHNPDLNSGDLRGFSMGPQTLDGELRWDAARAYLYPVEQRPNLKIMKGTVRRIIWKPEKRKRSSHNTSRLVASGVEYLTDDGKTEILEVKREVVVSAGAVRTPLILEGSGVGNPRFEIKLLAPLEAVNSNSETLFRILKSLGIETKINLPGVGENLIEQPHHTIAFSGELEPSASAYHTFVTMSDLFGSDVAQVDVSTQLSLQTWAQAAVDASNGALHEDAVLKQLRIQHNLLFRHNVTAAEILTVIAPGLLASQYWILLPFSRGSVHLGFADKINEPVINPRLLLADFDVTATVAAGKLAQKFWLSQPMAKAVGGPLSPGQDVLPNDATDAQWEKFTQDFVEMGAHALGTASMMDMALGGVVDPELKVYGTANVRVVDASVLPTQISGHLTATLYAVAERGSDIIKRAWS